MFHNGVVGDENYLAVSEVFVERVGWNRTDCVAYSDVGNILPHGIDNRGSIISYSSSGLFRVRMFVVAPHSPSMGYADRFYLDEVSSRTNGGRTRLNCFRY